MGLPTKSCLGDDSVQTLGIRIDSNNALVSEASPALWKKLTLFPATQMFKYHTTQVQDMLETKK